MSESKKLLDGLTKSIEGNGWVDELVGAGATAMGGGITSAAVEASARYEELQVRAFMLIGNHDEAAHWWATVIGEAKQKAYSLPGRNSQIIFDHIWMRIQDVARDGFTPAGELRIPKDWRRFGFRVYTRAVQRRTNPTTAMVMFWQGPWWLRWLRPWKGRWIASIGNQEIAQRETAEEAMAIVDLCVEGPAR